MAEIDEIARLEAQGIERTRSNDWSGAREFFSRALDHQMPALRRAEIIRSVMGTYYKQGDSAGVRRSALDGLRTLDDAQLSGGKADKLRAEFSGLASGKSAGLPLGTFSYAIAFFAGVYAGFTFAVGPPVYRSFMTWQPPVLCLGYATLLTKGFTAQTIVAAVTLYSSFLPGFAIGYGLATSGIIKAR